MQQAAVPPHHEREDGSALATARCVVGRDHRFATCRMGSGRRESGFHPAGPQDLCPPKSLSDNREDREPCRFRATPAAPNP
jgi:hypothetical protein